MLNPNTRNNFVPASQYHGDRWPRTLEQAFGPGAQLHVEERVQLKRSEQIVFALAGLGLLIELIWALAQQ